MPIRFCNSLTYSDSLFPFTGLESKHSAGSPPSPSYLGNCRFFDNSKQQSNSRSPSPLSSYSESSHTAQSPSSSKSFIVSNTGRLGPSHKFNSNNQSPRTPSPFNSNRSSRSTSPRNAFNAVKQLTSPTYEAGSDEPIHRYINFYQMRRRNGGGMSLEDYKADMVFYQEASEHDWKIRNKAMIELNAKWNSSLDANVLDLHHLLPSQVHRVIEAKIEEIKSRNWKRLYVVTGAGRNSLGGVAKLKPAAEKYAEKNGYRYAEMDGNPGAIIISVARR